MANKQPEADWGPEQEQIAKRVQARWDALIQGDYKEAYKYQTPGYRKTYTAQQYRAKFGDQVGWLSAAVKSVKVKEDAADLRVSVKYRAMLPGFQKVESVRLVEEKWLKEEDDWFHVMQ